jgi:DNA-binding CsgD family transcriptional regulator
VLGLSLPTVNEHLQHIYRHFHVNTRAALLAYFVRREPGAPPSSTR